MKTKVAWTRRLHPQKNPNVLFERCEQPIDVKAGLKIPANSSVWLDFRGEKSPRSPLWLLQQWTRLKLISLKKNLPYDSVVLFRGEEPLLKHLVLHSVFSKLGTELIAEIALHPSFPSRFKTMWYHDLLVEKFFLQLMEITVVFHKLLFFTYTEVSLSILLHLAARISLLSSARNLRSSLA